jgi:cell division protein FtsQ
LRSGNLFSGRETTGLDAPEPGCASAQTAGRPQSGPRRASAGTTGHGEYGYAKGSADGQGDGFEDEFAGRVRRPGVRLSFSRGLAPKTLWGRVAAGGGLVLLAGVGVAGLLAVRSFLLRDPHFTVEGPASIQIAGNSRLTRPQLLSVFGGDVERNIFNIPLAERRAELERLPWVAHATVMRLLPNRVRVAIVERTPVAFVRQGSEIGLVDAHGVLLDLPGVADSAGGDVTGGDAAAWDGSSAPAAKASEYSFPVLTGISAEDPLSTRAARMRIYMGFVAALDASGEKISRRLSEVDLSNPEDVKAILPGAATGAEDGSSTGSGASAGESSSERAADRGADVLVHFGDAKFLERYRQYEQHLAEWRAQYPKLVSVDMRYERQVVLEMQPGDGKGEEAGVGAGANGVHPTHVDKAAMDGAPGPGSPRSAAKPKAPVAKPSGAAGAPGAPR